MYQLKSCYMPYRVPGYYTKNIKSFLNNSGIETVSLHECIKNPKIFVNCKIFNLNWFENIQAKTAIGAWLEYFCKSTFVMLLKLCGKKIIYTLHNKQPHSGKNCNISKHIMRMIVKRADAVVIMCDESRKVLNELGLRNFEKVEKILHPSFVQNYTETEAEKVETELVMLFFGTVQPYKNIELLIRLFSEKGNENIQLRIVGNPVSKEYKNKIESLISGKENIKATLRFIQESEIPYVYANADIVILPYDYTSSLNSGSVYLSFSLSKTVICPDIGSITEMKDKSFIYHYTYQNEEEHIRALQKILDQIQMDGKAKVKEYGNMARKYIMEVHSDQVIEKQYAQLYKGLTGKK